MKFLNPIRAEDIARIINAEIVGDPSLELAGINEIHKVGDGDICFVDHPKYYRKCIYSPARAIIINSLVECPEGKVLLVVQDPIEAYNTIVELYRQEKFSVERISTEAVVHPSCVLHPGVVIADGVEIGEGSIIYPNVVIYPGCIIGKRVIIHAGSVIGSDAYYYKRYQDRYGKLTTSGRTIIEDDVEIGACCTIARGVSGDTVIGRGTKLDGHVYIGHGVTIGRRCLIAAQVGIAGKTSVGDEVMLWGQVGVSKGLKIGSRAVVLAQSGVAKSLDGNRTYFGSPCREAREEFRARARYQRSR